MARANSNDPSMIRGIHIGKNGYEILRMNGALSTIKKIVRSDHFTATSYKVGGKSFRFTVGTELSPRVERFASVFSKSMNKVLEWNDLFICGTNDTSITDEDVKMLREVIYGNVIVVD
jgi:hypothetical protein